MTIFVCLPDFKSMTRPEKHQQKNFEQLINNFEAYTFWCVCVCFFSVENNGE